MALGLSKLRHDASWMHFKVTNKELTFEEWRQEMISKSPTFHYWDPFCEFEILVMIFIRAHRTNDFNLYVESLEALYVPWILLWIISTIATWWIPIHIRDMKSLSDNVKKDLKRCWVLRKLKTTFLVCQLTKHMSKATVW